MEKENAVWNIVEYYSAMKREENPVFVTIDRP